MQIFNFYTCKMNHTFYNFVEVLYLPTNGFSFKAFFSFGLVYLPIFLFALARCIFLPLLMSSFSMSLCFRNVLYLNEK